MKKLTIGNIVDFRTKSPVSQITLIKELNKPKEPKEESEGSGGHYWISSLSAIRNALKQDNKLPILEKTEQLEEKLETESKGINKIRWQKNIDMLNRFENYDFSILQPKVPFEVLKGLDGKAPLIIHGVPVTLIPDYIVAFEEKGVKKIGSAMFVGRTKQFQSPDLAIFNDALYRYVVTNVSSEYEVSKELCQVVDVMDLSLVKYTDVESGKTPSHLDNTLIDIKKLIN